ncbi:MAG: urease accessory protein UreF, partial [Oscillospiraceae bacterium]
VGLFIRDLGLEAEEALTIFCYSLISALVTNAVKLIPLGRMDGQCVLNGLFPAICAAVTQAMSVSPEAIGISGAGFDIGSMAHETLYSRMYMS